MVFCVHVVWVASSHLTGDIHAITAANNLVSTVYGDESIMIVY